jgi:large conductance mechanosensitive channel
MLKEFKAFIFRGNVIDLAVGVIIAGAFGAIINSLIADIITPLCLTPILKGMGVADLESWKPGGMLIGKFIASVLSFIVIAFVLFMMIKGVNKATAKKEAEAPAEPAAPPADIQLLTEIRDALRK